MARLKILSTRDGGSEMVELGEVDDSGLTYGNGTAYLGSPGCHQLVDLLGTGFSHGYGMRVFNLVKGERVLRGCRVVHSDAEVKIDYMDVGRR